MSGFAEIPRLAHANGLSCLEAPRTVLQTPLPERHVVCIYRDHQDPPFLNRACDDLRVHDLLIEPAALCEKFDCSGPSRVCEAQSEQHRQRLDIRSRAPLSPHSLTIHQGHLLENACRPCRLKASDPPTPFHHEHPRRVKAYPTPYHLDLSFAHSRKQIGLASASPPPAVLQPQLSLQARWRTPPNTRETTFLSTIATAGLKKRKGFYMGPLNIYFRILVKTCVHN